MPQTLKVISIASVGYDRYDLGAMTKRGIILTNNPGLGAAAVADIALYLLLATFRFTSVLEHALRTERQLFQSRNVLNTDRFIKGVPKRGEKDGLAFGDNVAGKSVTCPTGKRCGIVG
jgi:glyoxylate reductase